jgi:esterase/lipase superfamily enzyme
MRALKEHKIRWRHEPFIVTTAHQPTRLLLAVLNRLKPQWVVIHMIQENKDYFYIYRRGELRKLLANASATAPVTDALALPEIKSSLQSRTSRRPRFATRGERGVGSAANRIVHFDKSGRLSAIGEITSQIGRVVEIGPKPAGQKRGIFVPEASGSFKRLWGVFKTRATKERGRGAKYKAKKRAGRKMAAPATQPRPRHRRDYEIVQIFYATDRKLTSEIGGHSLYADERCDDEIVQLGTCDVAIPETHVMGKFESPTLWRFEFAPDPRKHIVLLQTTRLPEQHFFDQMRSRISQSNKNDAFVFVHGYNVRFEDAARRTAQIAYDLQFQGAPVLYSWPSRGKLGRYPADEATIDWTRPHLVQFLKDIAARSGAGLVHVIAHSMGNRALMRALKDVPNTSQTGVQFSQVVLTAPDIDSGEFMQLAREINRNSERITLYASSTDEAIRLSRRFHDHPRAGEAGRNILVIAGVDTVDASNVDTTFLAHSYFSSKRTVLSDLSYLIREGYPPERRHGLERKRHSKGTYWAFRR